jgi:hypothetical protein
MVNSESPGRAKDVKAKDFLPFGALAYANSYQGFAALIPGYCLIAPCRGSESIYFHDLSEGAAREPKAEVRTLLKESPSL